MKNVLIVSYGGGHINALLPLVRKIQTEDKFNCIVFALPSSIKKLNQSNIKYISYKDFVTEEELYVLEKYQVDQSFFQESIPLIESQAYYAVGLYEYEKMYGYDKTLNDFSDNDRKIFFPIKKMEHILNSLKIDLLITTSSPRSEHAALLAGENLNLSTFRIEQLFYCDYIEGLKNTVFFVMNDYVKSLLINKGISNCNIYVTGQPAFEEVVNFKKNFIYTSEVNDVSLIDNVYTIFYSSPGNTKEDLVFKYLVDFCCERKSNYKLIVKLHPNESGEEKLKYIEEKKSVEIYKSDLYLNILKSDVVIVQYSAVGFEAINLDKDLITVNLYNKNESLYSILGASYEVKHCNLIRDALENIRENKGNIRERLKGGREKMKTIVNATDSILGIIKRIIYENKNK